jgi:Peptidase family M28
MICHPIRYGHSQYCRAISSLALCALVLSGCATDRQVAAQTAVPPGETPINQSRQKAMERATNPLNAQRSYNYLAEICALGPRISGSPGMRQQQALVKEHFEKLGGKVSFQRFEVANPLDGVKVPMANLICEWQPQRKERILLCAHYDTRPLPDQDPDPLQQKQGVFLGANDGASGVAVMMELAHVMSKLEGDVGVDFVLFDGEEFVYVEGRDAYFLGSEHFAKDYATKPPAHKYRWGVLMDMVGDANLKIYEEQHSVTWRDTRPLVKEIWATAGKIGVEEFVPRVGYRVLDDHLALRNTAKIPTCDIIDFDYAYWHTVGDVPQRCSGTSLAKVGWVVYEWIRGQGSRVEGPEK